MSALPINEEEDVFRGYLPEDVARIAGLIDADTPADPAFFTDALGIRVDSSYCPWIGDRLGQRSTDLPLPSDGYLGPAVEYAALALAFELANPANGFTVVEIGAGWGPWVSAAGAVARRRGFSPLRLVAMEASPSRFAQLRRHLAINDLVPAQAASHGSANGLSWQLERAAISPRDGTLYWPAADAPLDAGMAALDTASARTDYRGIGIETVPVPALSLETLLKGIGHVDFMHIDIQGSEWDVVSRALDILGRKVRSLFIGTHSRKIEGDLIELMRRSGWTLHREKPCQFYTMAASENLAAVTYHDGAQFWVNDQLGRSRAARSGRTLVKRLLGR